jgi:opacity protein-like surface antigen
MKRFAIIAVVLALTSAAAQAQSTAQLTPQQKQDLSGYNFKGAETALQAQTNQSAPKQESLTPIPTLKVPPIVSSVAAGQSSQPPASTEKGSAVPLNWKLPHADLNTVGLNAAEVSRLWETGVSMPTQGENGKVVYIYG